MKITKLICKAEADRPASQNRSRLYNVVRPLKDGEAKIETYAVKTEPSGGLAVKKVARYYTSRRRYWTRDILFCNTFHSYVVNWCEKPWGRKHQAVWEDVDAYQGRWGYNDYGEDGCQPLLWARYLNDFSGTRYARCGYDVSGVTPPMHILEYLECWRISPSVEFLAKAGMWQLIAPAFVRRLATDRGAFAFFRANAAEIRRCGYGRGAIRRAMRTGESLAEAKWSLHWDLVIARHKGIPVSVPRKELAKYLQRTSYIDIWGYESYCADLASLGMDIDAYGAMFPTKRRFDEVHDAAVAKAEEERERRNKREAARQRRERRERLARWKSIREYCDRLDGARRGRFEIVIPQSVKDLKREGQLMRNCIGTYGRRWSEGRAILFFLYADGKPCVDVEVSTADYHVIQARLKDNRDADADAHAVANEIARQIAQNTKTKTNKRKAA